MYDSDSIGAEDVLLCLKGENYRCFQPSDWCNLGQGVRSTTQDLNGYKCMCATEVIGSCAWRDAPIGEMDSLANCCDNIDNNCNGLMDSAESGCPVEESEAALPGSCSDDRDNDCDGLIDCDDDGCDIPQPPCCIPLNDPCTSSSECCGYTGDYDDILCHPALGICYNSESCTQETYDGTNNYQICWNTFCIKSNVIAEACCSVDKLNDPDLTTGGFWEQVSSYGP